MNSNIKKDLNELLDQQVITQDIAKRIEAYYNSKEIAQPNRLFIAFGILGATLLGLGIILVLAHNWDEFSKIMKSVIAFVPLLIGQGVVGYSIFKSKSLTWRESSGVFLFFAVGASIALISQIYNIPGNFATYMMTWVLLCVPMIYLLKSNAVALLTLIFATNYACAKGYDYGNEWGFPYLYLVYLLVFIPHYFKMLRAKVRSNWVPIFNWLLPLSFTIVLAGLTKHIWTLSYLFLFGLFYNLGKLPVFSQEKLRTNGFLIFGSVGTVTILLILTFNFVWKDFVYWMVDFKNESVVFTVLLFIVALAILLFNKKYKNFNEFNTFQFVFIGFLAIYFVGIHHPEVAPIMTNVALLALGLNVIRIGSKTNHLWVLNYGMLIITAMIVFRFFDEEISFAVKGLLFMLIGVGFFVMNYVMLKRRK